MPTDSYSCKSLWACVKFVSLLLCFTHNLLATNPYQNLPADSTITNGNADSTSTNLTELLKPNLRLDMVDYAKRFLGSRYRYAGRSASGFDCSGFTHYINRNFNIQLSTCSRSQGVQGVKVLLKDTKSGDLVFFRRSKRSSISHVAMVVSNDERGLFIIHSTYRGVVVDNLMESSYWRPKIYMARDVANPFAEKYAAERAQQVLAQQAKLKSLHVDLERLAKGLSI